MIASGFRIDDQPSGAPDERRFLLEGELDAQTAQGFVADVEGQIGDEVRQVHLDMDRLQFIDSAGLRALVQLDERLRSGQCRLVLERPTDGVRHVLRITSLDGHFEIAAA